MARLSQPASPTWLMRQPSTASAWALHTLAARELADPAKWACVCPHTQSQPKEHLGHMQNSHVSVSFSHLRCKTELPCVKHVTRNPCWQAVPLQGDTWTALAIQLSHIVSPCQQRILDIYRDKKNQTDISNNADVKQLGKKFKTTQSLMLAKG